MINWKWKVRALTMRPILNSLQNVVATVHWSIVMDNNGTEVYLRDGYTYLNPPDDGSQFVAYENLTEAECINWVKNLLDPKTVIAYEAEAQHKVLQEQGIEISNTNVFPWN